jgi:hypothetical protein
MPSHLDIRDFQDANYLMFNAVEKFNAIAGKNGTPDLAALKNQAKLVLEEAKEIVEGLENKDPEEVLDGAIDTMYTLSGFVQMLQKLNFGIYEAALITCDNNLTKFPDKFEDDRVNDTIVQHPNGRNLRAVYNAQYSKWAILDEHDKVVKPLGYKKNDLSECVTKTHLHVFEE